MSGAGAKAARARALRVAHGCTRTRSRTRTRTRTLTYDRATRNRRNPGPQTRRHHGALYHDSEAFGGITSSPLTHGFDLFNATVEVAPTATTNCQCDAAWQASCDFGHNEPTNHCTGSQGPDPNAAPGCCFNYWHGDAAAPHGVRNHTLPTPDDDATYNADAFVRFAESLGGAPFLAQVSFHTCHIPFVGTPARVAACNASGSAECAPPLAGAAPYNHQELDFYACLNELDSSVGTVSSTVTPAPIITSGSASASPMMAGVATNRQAPTR